MPDVIKMIDAETKGAIKWKLIPGGQVADAKATFTAVNRLVAVRVGEGIGALPEVISRGRESQVFRDIISDLFPLIGREQDGGLWIYLMACGDELAASAPLLFDRRSPVSVFAPGRATGYPAGRGRG